MKFEWDENKNRINRRKHGIDFRVAAMVFDDFDRVELRDELHSDFEDRYITIGYANKILVVVYTERGDATRIISAREADREEREMYYEHRESYH